ncbi:hypothetical protein ACFLW4_07255, partial [Chloroflexota bacterium]
VILGVCLIIYIGLGIIYVQQGPKVEDLENNINKMLLIVNKPLPSMEELSAEYDAVNLALIPMETPDILALIVGIAKDSGIYVDPESAKFHIPPPSNPQQKKLGEDIYQIVSFKNIRVQGDYDNVMAFITDLDAGTTKETILLKRVGIEQVELKLGDEEIERREEFREVMSAMLEMMSANDITEIPNPVNYDGGIATSNMSAFPDITTTAADKGYTGTENPKNGYVLFEHDIIFTDNTTQFETTDYIDLSNTHYIDLSNTLYYYTCETDGKVRQFDGPDLATATEYFGSEEVVFEFIAQLDIDLYSKPEPVKE